MVDGRYTVQTVLKKFGFVDGDHLTNAGNVLFGNSHPVTLKAAVFATDEKLTFLDMQMYEDNILNLLGIAEKYILKNINWRSEIVGMEREEIPEIPVAAVREILANSYAHAVYNGSTYHEICIHPSKVTIYSPGSFASTYSPEDYINKNLQSSIRNAAISKILYLNKSIEQFGSGFKRINSLCKDAGIKYSYEFADNGFTFIFYRKVFICSPYRGNIEENMKKAKFYGKIVVGTGRIPVILHLYFPTFLDENNPNERMTGIEMGLELMDSCDEVYVFGFDITEGMKFELDYARKKRNLSGFMMADSMQ
jgi:predicted HTH transcriptional regulator